MVYSARFTSMVPAPTSRLDMRTALKTSGSVILWALIASGFDIDLIFPDKPAYRSDFADPPG